MKRLSLLLGVLVLFMQAWCAEPVTACPLCKEAIEKTTSEQPSDDPLREARAWNQSIYLMVSMPYLLLGGLGLLIYREYRKKVRAAQLAAGEGAGGGEDLSCSDPSLGGNS